MEQKAVDDLIRLSLVDREMRKPAQDRGIGGLERKRAALRHRLPGPLLAVYDSLDRAGRHPPVAAVVRDACSGCNLALPPQLQNEVLGQREMRTCPYCRRLLHASAKPSAPPHA